VEVIPDATDGKPAFPSAVAFVPIGTGQFQISVGAEAIAVSEEHPSCLLYNIKRLLARKITDSFVRKEARNWPFRIVGGKDERVRFEVGGTLISVEEASSYVLKRAKSNAEHFLSRTVNEAVVTVPAHFNDTQRQAIRAAGALAGLNVIRIVSESTSACLAYGHGALEETEDTTSPSDSQSSQDEHRDSMSLEETASEPHSPTKERKVVTVDLGGGFLNVSAVVIDDGVYQVLAVSGSDAKLGGEDFTQRVMNYFVEEIKRKTRGYDIRNNAAGVLRLRAEVEKMKKELSKVNTVELDVKELRDERLNELSNLWIDRKRFQEITTDLCETIFIPIQQVLRDAKLSKEEIDEVVLMGGSMSMPKLRELLSDFFKSNTNNSKNGTRVYKQLSADQTVVARGAAIQAAIMAGVDQSDNSEGTAETAVKRRRKSIQPLKDMLLLDVIPSTLGVYTAGGILTPIIPRNTSVPASHTRFFTVDIPTNWNISEGTSKLTLQIYEGEHALVSKNSFLDELELEVHLRPTAPDPHIKIEVRFSLDASSILTVAAAQIETVPPADEDEGPQIQVLSREELVIQYGRTRKRPPSSKQKEVQIPSTVLKGKALSNELSSSLVPVYYHQPVAEALRPIPT